MIINEIYGGKAEYKHKPNRCKANEIALGSKYNENTKFWLNSGRTGILSLSSKGVIFLRPGALVSSHREAERVGCDKHTII